MLLLTQVVKITDTKLHRVRHEAQVIHYSHSTDYSSMTLASELLNEQVDVHPKFSWAFHTPKSLFLSVSHLLLPFFQWDNK